MVEKGGGAFPPEVAVNQRPRREAEIHHHQGIERTGEGGGYVKTQHAAAVLCFDHHHAEFIHRGDAGGSVSRPA